MPKKSQNQPPPHQLDKRVLRQIAIEQREEIRILLAEDLMIPRERHETFTSQLEHDLVLVVMGIRRCGKSVLTAQLVKEKSFHYFNFDDDRLASLRTEDLQSVLETLVEMNPDAKVFLFDEIQNVKGWELFANRLKRRGYKLLITGSNAHLLSRELATHLTGRHLSLELFPFSFSEFIRFKQIHLTNFESTENKAHALNLFRQYFDGGGFPEVCKGVPSGPYLRELFDKIVSRDIVTRHSLRTGKVCKEIGVYCHSQIGSRISYQSVAKTFGIKSVNTVRNYLNHLDEAYLIFQLENYSHKIKERMSQARKIYSIDTGMISALNIKITQDLGARLENIVYLQLRRKGLEIFSLIQPKFEVDFLIKQGRRVQELIQVCYDATDLKTRFREMNSLVAGARYVQCDQLTILTWDEEGSANFDGHKIQILPVWKWLLQKT